MEKFVFLRSNIVRIWCNACICFLTVNILLIALYVSLADTRYNITEGRKLDVKLVASRPFSTNFYVRMNVSLLTANGMEDFIFQNV